MSEGGYPSVYVVDSHVSGPPVPPRLKPKRRQGSVAQPLLFLLVSLALCGMTIEACFIYRLLQYDSVASGSAMSSKQTAGTHNHPTEEPILVIPPSKPVAHLTDGQDVIHGSQIMAWSMDAEPLVYEMEYRDKMLIVHIEGYYYIYSKVFFVDTDVFHHAVHVKTKLYAGKSIPLLLSRKYSDGSGRERSNSYLGGVFHLKKDDALFVKVSNASKIERHRSYENVFGAYMI